MRNNKVESAMRFFEYEDAFIVPLYIINAFEFIEGLCHGGKL